jgi:hypothetical protein
MPLENSSYSNIRTQTKPFTQPEENFSKPHELLSNNSPIELLLAQDEGRSFRRQCQAWQKNTRTRVSIQIDARIIRHRIELGLNLFLASP